MIKLQKNAVKLIIQKIELDFSDLTSTANDNCD